MSRQIRFTLASKLTVAFAAVAVVPIVAVAGLAQRLIEQRYRGEFIRSLDAAQRDVVTEYDRAAGEVAAVAKRLARADDPVVGQLLLDLAKGGLDEERERSLLHRAPEQMRAAGLDFLQLVDDRAVVLAAGHYPGRAGQKDEAAVARGRRHPGKPMLVMARVVAGGQQRDALMIEVAQRVETDYARLTVVTGREVSSAFLERLKLPARLVGEGGKQLAVSSRGFPTRPYPRRAIELPGADAPARVEVAVPDEELDRALSWIRALAGAVTAGGLALALLLGFLVARRIARPLGALAEGARRVAAGDLDAVVDVHTRDEVGDLARTFNAMIRELGEAQGRLVHAERVAAWREIAQRIAHEIKNPLTPIQMAIETLQRARKAKPQLFEEIFDESSRTILEEVARLKHIVAEFSAFARMPEPQLQPVDVREIVEGALGLYAGAEVTIERTFDADLQVNADREQLQQVLRNLLENARDAAAEVTERRATIRVSARRVGERVEIAIADSGPGITAEARARLFTPYFTTKAHGTGLGLAIVHRIVTDHGGEIRVGGAEGEGAVFALSLPSFDSGSQRTRLRTDGEGVSG
ncbi:MAG: HAMP domain-containing protein [Myxococcales bacterium]|nr:HAMP domain-containing protein [Myxococcales bacterium]